jgi:hypothetical protein
VHYSYFVRLVDQLEGYGWRANFYPTGLNDSVVASAYAPSIPL